MAIVASITNLEGNKEALESIAQLEQELSGQTGSKIAVVAYSTTKFADLENDAIEKISEYEKSISTKLGENVVLVAYSVN